LKDDKNKQKAAQNDRRRRKRKERHGSDPRELESNNEGSDMIRNFLQPSTTLNINSTSDYRTPYLQFDAA
jgi:hypothetical protein